MYWCAVIAAQSLGAGVSNLHPLGTRPDQAAQIAELTPRAVIVDGLDHEAGAADLAGECPEPLHLTLGDGGETDLVRLAGAHSGPPLDLPDTPGDLAVAPISHVGGTKIVPVLLRGGPVYLMRGFGAGKVLPTIARARINMRLLVPTMIYALLDHPDIADHDLASLELLLYGAAPMASMAPARLAHWIATLGPVFARLYGQTECYPIAVLPRGDHDPDRPDLLAACGHPVSTAMVRLLTPEGDIQGHGRGLAAHRGHRHRGCRGAADHRGPAEGQDRVRRVQRLPERGRGRAGLA